jgi:hypothetical protein
VIFKQLFGKQASGESLTALKNTEGAWDQRNGPEKQKTMQFDAGSL